MSAEKEPKPIELFVDDSPESFEAIQLLEQTKLPCCVHQECSGHNLPLATLGPGGTWFTKLSGVEMLVRGLVPDAYETWLENRKRK